MFKTLGVRKIFFFIFCICIKLTKSYSKDFHNFNISILKKRKKKSCSFQKSILGSTPVFTLIKCFLSCKSAELILKDHMTLKAEVMTAENSALLLQK